MPRTRVVFFRDRDGNGPVVHWLADLMKRNPKAFSHCRARIELLAEYRHELRRPLADYLRDGIYELRAKQGHVQYRILYFFHGRQIAILAHALTKEDVVPPVEIERAKQRKREFEQNPERHTYEIEGEEKF